MTEIKALWEEHLDRRVADTIASSGSSIANWRTVGRTTKDKPNGEDLNWWRADGLAQAQAYQRWLETTDWKFVSFDGTPGIEFAFEVDLAGVTVRGFIDAIMVDGDGQMVVVDHKTGSRTPDNLAQLGLYATALEVLGYPRPPVGAFWMTRKGQPTTPESLDRYSVEYFSKTFNMFDTAVSNDVFIPHPGSHCRGCSVRDACYTAGGVDAFRYDTLHPAYRPAKQDTHKEESV